MLAPEGSLTLPNVNSARRSLSLAFVLPYGEPNDAFFPDTFLGTLCAVARERGHDAELIRVYYHGRDPAEDAKVEDRFVDWLAARETDVLVFERILDAMPIQRHRAQFPDARSVVVCRGDSLDPIPEVDLAVGAIASPTKQGSRRAATLEEQVVAFGALLDALSEGTDPLSVTGVAIVGAEGFEGTALPGEPETPPRVPLSVVEQAVIAPGDTPSVVRKTLFGNTGCPYRGDAMAALDLPPAEDGQVLASQGCAFCFMGGDYQKRPDAEVVASLVAQAVHLTADPAIEELVLADQFSYPYLRALMYAARDAGVRTGVRWLFAARCDAFLRTERVVRGAVEAAAECGYVLELYLAGFEAFSDTDLRRYNKGITVDEQLRAVDTMRALAAEFPDAFDYKRARGHSLILWNPWTTPESLLETAENLRTHGLMELFDEAARNRLRLYDELPIARAAARDGAVLDAWEDTDGGAARSKGYNPEQPWRFLDPRTRVAYRLVRTLRRRLGRSTELSQLRAAAEFARDLDPDALTADGEEAIVAPVSAAIDALSARVLVQCRAERQSPARGTRRRTAVVTVGGPCNNGCSGCTNADEWRPATEAALLADVETARSEGKPVLFAGREPTLHPAFLRAVQRARGDDARHVGVVTNGRRFAYKRFAAQTVAAGARAFSVKFFGASAEVADAYSGTPGGFEQACEGVRNLRAIGPLHLEVRFVLHAGALASAGDIIGLARALGADQVHVEFPIDAIGLGRFDVAENAVDAIASAAIDASFPAEFSTVEAGTVRPEWVNG